MPGPARTTATTPLGQLIRTARKAAGLTMRQLGARTSLSESYISRLESGKRDTLSADTAVQLAQALGLDPQEVKRVGGVEDAFTVDVGPGSVVATRDALLADRQLTAEQKNLLLGLYRSWVPSPLLQQPQPSTGG